jgi:DNA-binding GntR family transcriptional regulator
MSPQVERPRPPYQQVADHLRKQILHGRLKPGDAVPSERQLADEWGISRSTATKAAAALRMEGLVEARQGSVVCVSSRPSLRQGATTPPEALEAWARIGHRPP